VGTTLLPVTGRIFPQTELPWSAHLLVNSLGNSKYNFKIVSEVGSDLQKGNEIQHFQTDHLSLEEECYLLAMQDQQQDL